MGSVYVKILFWSFSLFQLLTASNGQNACHPLPCGDNSDCWLILDQPACTCKFGYIGKPPSCRSERIECLTDGDCSKGLACLKQKCRASCPQECGEGALCTVNRITYHTQCVCPRGFRGDPLIKCTQIQTKKVETTTKPKLTTSSPQTEKSCSLPDEAKNRKFCSFQCSDCERSGCWLWPGSKVTDFIIKVQCEEGYRSLDNLDYTTIGCINGNWSQRFPQCIRLCPPLKSDSVFPSCFYGVTQVDCNAPMLPGTSATYRCRGSHREYPSLTAANIYSRTLFCKPDSTWTYSLPECEPVCGVSKKGTITPVVLNGNVTQLGAFPWHAGLYKQDESGWNCVCGGSLVTNRIVLTAAHCVFKTKAEELKVGLGKVYRSWTREESTAVKRDVSIIQLPDEYQGESTNYAWDIALLLLNESVELNSYVMPVCRDTNLEFRLAENDTGYVVGWGRTVPGGQETESGVLLHNDLIIMSRRLCSRHVLYRLLFDKFCAAKDQMSIAEKGDSGGGFTSVMNNLHYIFGIVSFKFENLSVFTNVTWTFHMQWIDHQITHLTSLI